MASIAATAESRALVSFWRGHASGRWHRRAPRTRIQRLRVCRPELEETRNSPEAQPGRSFHDSCRTDSCRNRSGWSVAVSRVSEATPNRTAAPGGGRFDECTEGQRATPVVGTATGALESRLRPRAASQTRREISSAALRESQGQVASGAQARFAPLGRSRPICAAGGRAATRIDASRQSSQERRAAGRRSCLAHRPVVRGVAWS